MIFLMACELRRPDSGDTAPDTTTDTSVTETDSTTTYSTPTTETGTTEVHEAMPLVLVVTEGALNSRFIGTHADYDWQLTPIRDALASEGVVVPRMVMPRGVPTVSLATTFSGRHPASTKVRDDGDLWVADVPSLPQSFLTAGWHTTAILSAECPYGSAKLGFASTSCQEAEGVSHVDADAATVLAFQDALAAHPDEPLFVWVHLASPQSPWEIVEETYPEGEPAYTGTLDADDPASLDSLLLEGLEYTEADRRYVEAAYASAVTQADLHLEQIVAAADTAGRWDDALFVLGTAHGEELAENAAQPYFWHECSDRASVLVTEWFFRHPSLPGGNLLPWFVGAVDITPTILELAGVAYDATTIDGTSLVPTLLDETLDPDRPAYFERSTTLAGVVYLGHRYTLNPLGAYRDCSPFDEAEDLAYTSPTESVYALTPVADEETNLLETSPAAEILRETLCNYVAIVGWDRDPQNVIIESCRPD